MLFLLSYFSEFLLQLVTLKSCNETQIKQAGAEFGQAQQLVFQIWVCLVFAFKDRLSLRYGSVRNLLLKDHPNGI